jgi:asparagine synthase (glutamine-hydrolysing)
MTQSISLPSLLRFEDRNSMAHCIEARVPFLDSDLAEFALSLGGNHKIEGAITKTVLRRALGHRLPASVMARREKLGFQTPEAQWLSGEGKAQFAAGLDDALERLDGCFNGGPTREWVQGFLDGSTPYTTRLWRVFVLGRWARLFGVET